MDPKKTGYESLRQLDNCVNTAEKTIKVSEYVMIELNDQGKKIDDINIKTKSLSTPIDRSYGTISNMISRDRRKTIIQLAIIVVCVIISILLIVLMSIK